MSELPQVTYSFTIITSLKHYQAISFDFLEALSETASSQRKQDKPPNTTQRLLCSEIKSPCIVLNIISLSIFNLWTSQQKKSPSQVTLLASYS